MSKLVERPDVVVPGERVFLGPLRKELVPVYRRWINDLVVTRTLAPVSLLRPPLTDEDEADWYERTRASKSDVTFTVYEQPAARPVGTISLKGIDHYRGSAELGVLIGDRTVWGRGYGTEAVRLILDYGFTVLGLNHVWLNYAAANERGRRAYERAGFRETGRLREGWRIGNERQDVVIMDILAREFTSPVLARLLTESASEG